MKAWIFGLASGGRWANPAILSRRFGTRRLAIALQPPAATALRLAEYDNASVSDVDPDVVIDEVVAMSRARRTQVVGWMAVQDR